MGKKLTIGRAGPCFHVLRGSCWSCPKAARERSRPDPRRVPIKQNTFFFLPRYFLHCQVEACSVCVQRCCTMRALLTLSLAITLKLFKLKLLLREVLFTSAGLPSPSAVHALVQLGDGSAANLSWKGAGQPLSTQPAWPVELPQGPGGPTTVPVSPLQSGSTWRCFSLHQTRIHSKLCS